MGGLNYNELRITDGNKVSHILVDAVGDQFGPDASESTDGKQTDVPDDSDNFLADNVMTDAADASTASAVPGIAHYDSRIVPVDSRETTE